MKKQHKNPAQTDRMWFAHDPHIQKILHHFVSPLEWEAYENMFRTFDYDMDGTILHIDGHVNNVLLGEAKRRVRFFFNILRRERIKRALSDPQKLAFLYSRPEEHVCKGNLQKQTGSI